MRWRTKTGETHSGTGDADSKRSSPSTRHSPGLEAALERLREDEPVRVLDLGPAVGANIQFLSDYAHHIRVVDLFGQTHLFSASEELEEHQVEALAQQMIPSRWGSFDLVFAWDLFDYLNEIQLRAVAGRLWELCDRDARLFAVVGTTHDMPRRPLEHSIVDRSTVSLPAQDAERVPCPQWPPALVERVLRGFSIERSFVLRCGLQEFVAIRK